MNKIVFSALMFAFAIVAVVSLKPSQVAASTWQTRYIMTSGDAVVIPVNYPTQCLGTAQHKRKLGTLNVAQDKVLCVKNSSAFYASETNLAPLGYIYLGTTANMKHIWMNPFNGSRNAAIVPANLVPAYAAMGFQQIGAVGFDLDR